jgi:hypothetical protein
MRDIRIRFQPARPLKAIRLLNDARELEASAGSEGWISLTVPELNHYEIVLFEYK